MIDRNKEWFEIIKKEFESGCYEVVEVDFTDDVNDSTMQFIEQSPGYCSSFSVQGDSRLWVVSDKINETEEYISDLEGVRSAYITEVFQTTGSCKIRIDFPKGTPQSEGDIAIYVIDHSEVAELISKELLDYLLS